MRDDRGQVDVARRNVRQSMTAGSKQKSVWSASIEALEEPSVRSIAKARLGLGVGAVELDVAERPLGQRAPLLEPSARFGELAADRQRVDDPLCGTAAARVARRSSPCTLPRPGKDHFGTTIGWPRLS